VTPREVFRDAGLVPIGPQLIIDRPIEGAIARFTPTSIAVAIRFPFPETYEAPAGGPILDLARALGGVLLGVTHAVNPEEVTEETLCGAMMSGQLFTGWVRPDEPRSEAQASEFCRPEPYSARLEVSTALGERDAPSPPPNAALQAMIPTNP
jgi:hypothetical protein